MTPVDIEAEFADLDTYYPGSRRKRREASDRPGVVHVSWDASPITKMLGGVETEFFTVGALAAALGKRPVTIRLWERKAYIPQSPYRLPSHTRPGGTTFTDDTVMPGKRVFTRALIEAAVEEFDKRGLLGAVRVEWSQHDDLTIALVERWTAITSA